MKKVLALVLAVLMLAAIAPMAFAAPTVDITVSIDGKLVVFAETVATTATTLDGVLKDAHKALYKDGEAGYVAGIDSTYNIYLITKCWGVAATPYILVNHEAFGADTTKGFADTYEIKAGDNIIISLSTDAATAAKAISMKADVSGTKATIEALQWTLDFATFTYKSAPFANAAVVDKSGKALGTTDAKGGATVDVPADGIICINGLAAIKVAGSTAPTEPSTPPVTPPATDYKVVLSSQAVKVNGVEKALEVYNIDGSNYFKLRDLAYVLNGTKSQFSVDFDQAKQAISCAKGAAYTANGTELVIGADKSASAVPSAQSLYIDGAAASLTAFNIGGNNFFKLRDLGTALGFNVDYDEATRTMLITSVA
jgi:hypothetical protein